MGKRREPTLNGQLCTVFRFSKFVFDDHGVCPNVVRTAAVDLERSGEKIESTEFSSDFRASYPERSVGLYR